jgi:hypothetical protein
MGRPVLSCILGGVAGAVGGALLLGVPTYFDSRSGFLGSNSDWTPVAVAMGLVLGGIPGAVIGLLVGLTNAGKARGAVIGAGIGLIILVILFALGLNPLLDREIALMGLSSIPVGGVIGLLVSAITNQGRNTDKEEVI